MAKGKANINNSEGVAPLESRSLRSRKRKCPSDELSQSEEVQATPLPKQDTEGKNTAVVIPPLQCLESPLQECSTITNQQNQAAGQSCFTKTDGSIKQKHAGETVHISGAQEETTLTCPNNYCQLQSCTMNAENYTNKLGNEEIITQEVTRPPSQTYTDQHQVLAVEEGSGSCTADIEEQLGANKNSQSNLERNSKASQEEPSNTCMGDVKEITKESPAGLPARKKRRMGMCGLTEKERSHFLKTQKCENGQNEAEMVKQQIGNNTADPVSQEEIICPPPLPFSPLSIPVGSVVEQSKAETKLQSSHCGEDNRAETEAFVTVNISDGTIALCYPGCPAEKYCGAEKDTLPGPEQTGEPKSCPSSERKVEEQQELEGSRAEIPEKQRKDENDGSGDTDFYPVITFPTNPSHNRGAEKEKDWSEASPLQVHSVIRTRDERKEEMIDDVDGADAGVSSADTRPRGLSHGSVELCEAAVTPSDSESKVSCDPGVEPAAGPSAVNTEQTQTRETTDPFGPGYSDYVSDSQLNSIALTEEEMIKREEDLGSSHPYEDATDLICGLIRELSSLNRKVMATHRELENLHRGNKTSKSAMR